MYICMYMVCRDVRKGFGQLRPAPRTGAGIARRAQGRDSVQMERYGGNGKGNGKEDGEYFNDHLLVKVI